MQRYVIIESKQDMPVDDQTVLSLFSEFITIDRVVSASRMLILYFSHETDVSFSDVILNMMADTYADLRIYVSHAFDDEHFMEEHRLFVTKLMETIDFQKHPSLDDRIILKEALARHDTRASRFMLRKYAKDAQMKDTVITYLESDMNTTVAARKLYVHRNTLIQRLDKFKETTGFDMKTFIDAYLVYQLLS
ncbi:MAG: helix-turn-helix domain-containing protein [Acholeplasmataceae bacterium]|nr:helix-turn-helix domain-containing protein [Acholeplasmataceae bacterium]